MALETPMRSFLRRVRKSRASRWTVRAVGVLGVLVAVLLIVQVTVLPGLVHRLLADKLAEFGLPEASFEWETVKKIEDEVAKAAQEAGFEVVGVVKRSFEDSDCLAK